MALEWESEVSGGVLAHEKVLAQRNIKEPFCTSPSVNNFRATEPTFEKIVCVIGAQQVPKYYQTLDSAAGNLLEVPVPLVSCW